jgi:hypothetical protein
MPQSIAHRRPPSACSLQLRLQAWMDGEVLGHVQLGVDDRLDLLLGDCGGDVRCRALQHQGALTGLDDVLLGGAELLIGDRVRLLEDPLELVLEVPQGLLGLVAR